MGQKSTKVQVYRGAASPSCDGCKSCITGALDSFVDYEELWTQLVDLVKSPLDVKGLRDATITQGSETAFTIAKTLDMKEFDIKTMQNLGLHRLLLDESQLEKWTSQDTRFTEKYKIDKASGRICAERFGTIGELVERSYTVLHRDPLRIEFWIEVPGFRRCGLVVMTAVRHRILNPAIKRVFGDGYMWQMFKGRGDNKDFLKFDCPSVCQPGQYSVVSDPLDDIVDFETLWAASVDVLRYPDPSTKDWEHPEVDQISEMEFHVRRVFNPEHPKAEELMNATTWDKVTLNKASGTIVADTYRKDGTFVVKTWFVINRNPIRVECWCEGPPARKAGTFVKGRLINVVNIILQRCEVAESITRTLTNQVDLDDFEDAEDGPDDASPAPFGLDAVEESPTPAPAPQAFAIDPEKKAQVLEAWRARGPEFDKTAKDFHEKAVAALTERARQAEEARKAEEERKAQEAQQTPEAEQPKAKPPDQYFECDD